MSVTSICGLAVDADGAADVGAGEGRAAPPAQAALTMRTSASSERVTPSPVQRGGRAGRRRRGRGARRRTPRRGRGPRGARTRRALRWTRAAGRPAARPARSRPGAERRSRCRWSRRRDGAFRRKRQRGTGRRSQRRSRRCRRTSFSGTSRHLVRSPSVRMTTTSPVAGSATASGRCVVTTTVTGLPSDHGRPSGVWRETRGSKQVGQAAAGIAKRRHASAAAGRARTMRRMKAPPGVRSHLPTTGCGRWFPGPARRGVPGFPQTRVRRVLTVATGGRLRGDAVAAPDPQRRYGDTAVRSSWEPSASVYSKKKRGPRRVSAHST